MTETIRSSRNIPCKGCPDRYPACSDHCKKPEYIAWKAEQARIREAKQREAHIWGYTANEIRKNRRRGGVDDNSMATRKVIHLCLSVEGGIRNARSLRGCIEVDGKTLQTTEEVRVFLRKQQGMGRKVLPMSPDCKNFDYQTGCQGCTVEVDP